ncbi:MAG: peptide ABC transporter substrate-binding protein [Niveispirillum sp.]|uniref:peptide ABC transporter substrate-binding protein n=1 Tax=Niveispirillum sp. TaxID=1917217 RepID=UPI003BA76E71
MRRLVRSLLLSSLVLLPLISPVNALAETVFRRGIGSAPGSIDPGKADLHPESIVIYDLYEGLLTPGPDGKPIAGAAASWEVSPDGRTYTFSLRPDGRWSDGSKVTAKDFVHAWRRLATPQQASPYAYYVWPIVNGKEVTAGTKPPTELGVEAVGDLMFRVKLTEPAAYFLGQVAHQSMSPVKEGATPGQVGNGAYKLAEMVPQTHLKLVKNPYFRDAANVKIDTVMHIVTENVDTELKRYRAGELDVTYTLPVTAVTWARQEAAADYMPTPTYSTFFMAFNLKHEPWKSSPKLRAALSMAIDREVIVDKVLQGDLRAAYSFTPPGKVAGYEPPRPSWAAQPQIARDALAKRLLMEAGYGPGGKPLPPVEILLTQSENNKRTMVAVAAMWKQKLGVETVMNNQEFRVVSSIGNQKTYKDVLFYGWIGDFADPINFLKLLRSDVDQQNYPAYMNPAYDALLDKANASLDPADRIALLGKAEAIMLEDNAVIPIFHNTRRRLVNPRVTGWTKAPLDQNPTRFLGIKE